ncbi:MAG: type II secretion system F family protein [Nanoarchaeota archaeon]|nr:type II secretion system F family protein [Nanoarchaeota archaeon]
MAAPKDKEGNVSPDAEKKITQKFESYLEKQSGEMDEKKARKQVLASLKALREKAPRDIKTEEYQEFTEKRVAGTTYEKLCAFAEKTLNVNPTKKDAEKLEKIIEEVYLNATPTGVTSLSLLVMIAFIILGLVGTVLLGEFTVFLVGLVFSFLSFMLARNYPKTLLDIRRTQSSSELVLAVLYIVVYMRHTPNLENAIKFAAENLTGPLSNDFKKILWDVQSKKYFSAKEGVEDYLLKWQESNRAFVDAMFLVESSLTQTDDERRLSLLNKALERILNGTYEQMVHYANTLRMPVQAIYMLGISLPVFTLIMLPIVSAFMSDMISSNTIFFMYNIILPVMLVVMIMKVFTKRPIGFTSPNLTERADIPKQGNFFFGKQQVPAILPAIIILVLLATPTIIYVFLPHEGPSELDVYLSMPLTLGVALFISCFAYLSTFQTIKIRESISRVENMFADIVFQLGNKLSEGHPVEVAVLSLAETMKKSEAGEFLRKIVNNMQNLGMSFEEALLNEKSGALKDYPSGVITAVFRILVAGARKSLDVAAVSLITMGEYLKDVHRIDEKIQDMLSESISTLQFQAAFIAPLITGIVIGLTAMIMNILFSLGEQMKSLSSQTSVPGMMSGSTFIFGFANISQATPLYIFQPIVGIYLIEAVIIMTYLLNQIQKAGDNTYFQHTLYKNLIISILVYSAVAVVVTVFFGGLATMALQVGMTL